MRIRITFHKTEEMRFTSHLDLHRAWERTFRRANLPLAYSQGYNPRPKINLASALPLGFTSENELLDVRFESELQLSDIATSLHAALPPGIALGSLEEIDPREPALQSRLQAAEYKITFLDAFPDLARRIHELLSASSLPREKRGKAYNLRPLIEELSMLPENEQNQQQIMARLAAREGATGRPEEVIAEMGYDPLAARVHRMRLIFGD